MADVPIDDEAHLVEVLDFLGQELEPSILIGGWATVHRVGGEISHDIDLIIASHEVRQQLEATLTGLSKSSHLQGTKWRGEFDGIHVDVYIPHQSQLGGKLRLRVEELAKHTDELGHGAWRLLTIEAHTISKMAALLDRPDTEKGAKDAREILRLLDKGVDARVACEILASATAGPAQDLPGHVAKLFDLIGPRAKPSKTQQKALQSWRREWNAAIKTAIAPQERARPELT
ncbi:hypothetical protein [Agrococcus sp. KRD186]|uniref:hypothetical protein n=1 Tax=Agrococcus sp. KRD186 TaxID=2729730 RepID=UPI0019D28092|nr:hypothetical protein [Agrococcus sp. KRD186]